MSAQEVKSIENTFIIDGSRRTFRTLSVQENGKLKSSKILEDIDDSLYQQRKDDGETDIIEINDKFYQVLREKTHADDPKDDVITYTKFADVNFRKELEKSGKLSFNTNLEKGQKDALQIETGIDFSPQLPSLNAQELEKARDLIKGFNLSTKNVELTFEGRRRKIYEILYYPETIATSKQDRIEFKMKYIEGTRDINLTLTPSAEQKQGPLFLGKRPTETIEGSVTLPIPGNISDGNNVKFETGELSVFDAAKFSALLDPVGAVGSVVGGLNSLANMSANDLRKLLGDSNLVNALRIYIAQAGAGKNNMFSRLGGGILNPNMELLFQAPGMRSFDYSFTMSARSRTEATMIKKIIRFFKQGMSVKKSNDNIFVVSPNLFEIEYQTGDGNIHPSIGRIKDCALVKLNTTYGDGSTYMTFDDPERTMTTYKIDMTFKELDPITEEDYLGEENTSTGPLADADEAFIGKNGVPLDHIGY